jgi:hypothetical protein
MCASVLTYTNTVILSEAKNLCIAGGIEMHRSFAALRMTNQKLIRVDPRRSPAEVYKLFGFGLPASE